MSGSLLWDSVVLASLAGHFVIRLHGFMLVCTWVYVCIYVYAITFFLCRTAVHFTLINIFFSGSLIMSTNISAPDLPGQLEKGQ